MEAIKIANIKLLPVGLEVPKELEIELVEEEENAERTEYFKISL